MASYLRVTLDRYGSLSASHATSPRPRRGARARSSSRNPSPAAGRAEGGPLFEARGVERVSGPDRLPRERYW